jgi:hypothetical protein
VNWRFTADGHSESVQSLLHPRATPPQKTILSLTNTQGEIPLSVFRSIGYEFLVPYSRKSVIQFSPPQSMGLKQNPPHSMGTKKSPRQGMGIKQNTPLWGVRSKMFPESRMYFRGHTPERQDPYQEVC